MKKCIIFGIIALFMVVLACSGADEKKAPLKVPVPLKAGLDDLADMMAAELLSAKKTKIALAPFSDLVGDVPDFGRFLADELGDRIMLKQKKLAVVKRLHIDRQLQAHNLKLSGDLSDEAAKEAGRLLKADAIGVGTFAVFEKTVKVKARLMAAESARVFAVVDREIILDNNIRKLIGEKKAASRWELAPEKVRKGEYDKRISRALYYIDQATKMKPLHSGEIEKRKALYKAALMEIELALSVYPKDPRGKEMKAQVKKALE